MLLKASARWWQIGHHAQAGRTTFTSLSRAGRVQFNALGDAMRAVTGLCLSARDARVRLRLHSVTRSLNCCKCAVAKRADVRAAQVHRTNSLAMQRCAAVQNAIGLLLRATRPRSSTRDGLWQQFCTARCSRPRGLLALDFSLVSDARDVHMRPHRTRRTQSHCIETAHSHLQCALRRAPSCGAGPSAVDRSQPLAQAVTQRGHAAEVDCLLVQVKAARSLAS